MTPQSTGTRSRASDEAPLKSGTISKTDGVTAQSISWFHSAPRTTRGPCLIQFQRRATIPQSLVFDKPAVTKFTPSQLNTIFIGACGVSSHCRTTTWPIQSTAIGIRFFTAVPSPHSHGETAMRLFTKSPAGDRQRTPLRHGFTLVELLPVAMSLTTRHIKRLGS